MLPSFFQAGACLADTAAAIRSGRLDPVHLVEECLERIADYESRVHAWVSVDPKGALEDAWRKKGAVARGEPLGQLHGIPLGVKDIVDVAGFPTRAGSPLRPDQPVPSDAPLVARLREAGAIVLGKTVTTEFAYVDPPPTRNPWDRRLRRTPGGSSSGSAVSVALGMCLGAIGSQTGGSLIRPASYCGVAACKPSFGRLPLEGVVPLAYHLDHAGLIARSAADCEYLLRRLIDLGDEPAVADVPPRLGLVERFFLDEADQSVRRATRGALERLAARGARIEVVGLPPGFDEVGRMHRRIMAVEAAGLHRESFLAQREAFGPKLAALVDEGLAVSEADYAAALAHQRAFRQGIGDWLARADAMVMPATDTTAPASLDTTGDAKFQLPWSYAGVPAVCIPCGLAPDGMPAGLQFISPHGAEASLLRIARWCERWLDFRELPLLLGQRPVEGPPAAPPGSVGPGIQ